MVSDTYITVTASIDIVIKHNECNHHRKVTQLLIQSFNDNDLTFPT